MKRVDRPGQKIKPLCPAKTERIRVTKEPDYSLIKKEKIAIQSYND